MKTLSYIFGRVVSSEINRSLARSEAQARKNNEIKRELASGQDAGAQLAKWAELNPGHPLIDRFTLEINKIDNDLRFTAITRGTKEAIVAENVWRLAQEETRAGRAQALPANANPVIRRRVFKGIAFLTIWGFLMATCTHKDGVKQAESLPVVQATPASTPESTPASVLTPAPTPVPTAVLTPKSSSAFDDYDFPASTPVPAKHRSHKHH